MIKIKRGSAEAWNKNNPKLADGQPGYDKDSHKLKIGDGKTPWNELPNAGGMAEEEILSSETDAKKRREKAKKLFPLLPALAKLISPAVMTYGTQVPNKDTVGQVYLQYYDAEPETDYVVEYGIDGIWKYQKWHSGFAKCWGTVELTTSVKNAFDGISLFYANDSLKAVKYPLKFTKVPVETATACGGSGLIWMASKTRNTESNSATYTLIGPAKLSSAKYYINIEVAGSWR